MTNEAGAGPPQLTQDRDAAGMAANSGRGGPGVDEGPPREMREAGGWCSLQARITLAALGLLVAGLWLLAFYTTRTLRDTLEREIGEQQFAMVTMVASRIGGDLRERLSALERTAAALRPETMAQPANAQAFLDSQRVLQQLFTAGLYIARRDANAIASVPDPVGRAGSNYLDRGAVRSTLRDGQARISAPYLGKLLKVPLVSMVVPVRDQAGETTGVLVGGFELVSRGFLERLGENSLGRNGAYFVVDAESRLVLSATDRSRVMTPFIAERGVPAIDRVLEQRYEGWTLYTDASGVETLASSRRVAGSGWVVHASAPARDAFAPIEVMQQRVLLAALLLTLLTGSFTWMVLRWQLAPMLRAASELVELSRRDPLPGPLRVGRSDEAGQLLESFNRLLARLAARESELRDSEERHRVALPEVDAQRQRLKTEVEAHSGELEEMLRPRTAGPPAPPDVGALEHIAGLAGMNRERVLEFRPRAAKYVQLLAQAATAHRADLERVAQALADRDHSRARQLAHSIKGAAGMLGADALMVAAAGLEHAIGPDGCAEDVQVRVGAVREALDAVVAAVESVR